MPNNVQEFKIPTTSDKEDKSEMQPDAFQLIGGSEEGEREYVNATLVEEKDVKNATTNYKNRKIGHLALFTPRDKMSA